MTFDYALFFQIGDGCIVFGDKTGYSTVFWPEQGEYANMTYFVTDDDFLEHIRIDHKVSPPEEIAVFTDGLQNLVSHFLHGLCMMDFSGHCLPHSGANREMDAGVFPLT